MVKVVADSHEEYFRQPALFYVDPFLLSSRRQLSRRPFLCGTFSAIPQTTGYELSPSGELIGFLKPVDSRLNIFVQPKSGGEAKQITRVKDRDIRGFFWKGDKYLLYLKDNGGDENFHLYVTRSDGTDDTGSDAI